MQKRGRLRSKSGSTRHAESLLTYKDIESVAGYHWKASKMVSEADSDNQDSPVQIQPDPGRDSYQRLLNCGRQPIPHIRHRHEWIQDR